MLYILDIESQNDNIMEVTFKNNINIDLFIKKIFFFISDTENNEDDHEEQLILQRPDTGEPDTLQFNIPESVTPVKQRRFAETRYISEIDLCDVATPRRAKRTLTLVKLIDKKKSKQIKRLQDTNRKLNKRIISLQQMVSHIRKKG